MWLARRGVSKRSAHTWRDLPHSAELLEDCVAVDVFSPVRQDWVRGDNAYLRG